MTSYNFKNPYLAEVKEKKELSHPLSLKKTYELILDIKGSGLSFQPGDCAVIFPQNDPEIVQDCLSFLKAKPKDTYFDPRSKTSYSVKEFLTYKANLSKVTIKMLKLFYLNQKKAKQKEKLDALLENEEALKTFLHNHHFIDLADEFELGHLSFEDFLPEFLPLMPRFYSISSSLNYHPDEIHLTVSYLTYKTANGKKHHGVTTHFLTQLAKEKTQVPLYIQPNPHFRLPEQEKPIIMVGVGTGIAPFISFLEERKALQSKAPSWLFFGERNQEYDFFYKDFLTRLEKDKKLKLTTAFSRDQEKKIYVQHRLLQNLEEIWSWLENKAVLYVCGDAKHMAKDVEEAFKTIIMQKKKLSEPDACLFLKNLREEKRYLKDVY